MAKSFSFDISSDFDAAELDHAVDQARREMQNRYDFKGTNAHLDYSEGRDGLVIEGDSEYQLDAILDMMRGKLAKRNLSQKILDVSQQREQAGMKLRQQVPFARGLDQEKSKKITKLIRDAHPKAKPQIQGDVVRVTSGDKDELQAIMAELRKADFPFPLQFGNYR